MTEPSVHDNSSCALIWPVLRRAHDRIERRLSVEFARLDLTISDFDVLLCLHSRSGEGVRIGSILESVALSQPALSRLVARLADRELLFRSGNEGDGRVTFVCLTEKGKRVIAQAIELHNTIIHDILTSRFTRQEQEALLVGLSQISR